MCRCHDNPHADNDHLCDPGSGGHDDLRYPGPDCGCRDTSGARHNDGGRHTIIGSVPSPSRPVAMPTFAAGGSDGDLRPPLRRRRLPDGRMSVHRPEEAPMPQTGDARGDYPGLTYRTDAILAEWLARRPREAALEPELPIIDPHHHFWDTPHRGHYVLPE